MDEHIWEFNAWIYKTYGRIGCLVALLITLSLLGFIFYLFSKLPEPKKVYWTKCNSCKYKCSKTDTFVLECSHYKDAPIFPLKRPMCTHFGKMDELFKHKGVGNDILEDNLPMN